MYFAPYFKKGMKLYMLAIGNYIIMSPQGKVFLFDTGRINDVNNIVIPFLRKLGVSEIEAIMISHNHFDHIQGAQYFMESFYVKKVYTKGVKSSGVFDISVSPAYNSRPPDILAQDAMHKKMMKYNIPHQVVRRGDIIFEEGNFKIEATEPTNEQVDESERIFEGEGQTVELTENPYDEPPYDEPISTTWENGQLYSYRPGDSGLIVKVIYGESTLAFPGDRRPLDFELVRDITVYAPTHHGDSRSSFFKNYDIINPKLVLLEYNHSISPERGGLGQQGTIDYFNNRGTQVYDFLGEVTQKEGYDKKRLELTLNEEGRYSISHINERDFNTQNYVDLPGITD